MAVCGAAQRSPVTHSKCKVFLHRELTLEVIHKPCGQLREGRGLNK